MRGPNCSNCSRSLGGWTLDERLEGLEVLQRPDRLDGHRRVDKRVDRAERLEILELLETLERLDG